jgi:hypothetical protein
MEINKYSDILGVVVCEDTVEGRFVLLTENIAGSHDFGSRTDLPGVIRPKNSAQAARANYVVTWIVPNQSLPLYIPTPSLPYSLRRGGFDQSGNLPFDPTAVHLTWPGQKNGVAIPSGFPAIAFAGGVFTIPSGLFIYNVGLRTPGNYVIAANDTDDGAGEGGKAKYSASATGAVGVVERFDVSEWSLTVRTFQP